MHTWRIWVESDQVLLWSSKSFNSNKHPVAAALLSHQPRVDRFCFTCRYAWDAKSPMLQSIPWRPMLREKTLQNHTKLHYSHREKKTLYLIIWMIMIRMVMLHGTGRYLLRRGGKAMLAMIGGSSYGFLEWQQHLISVAGCAQIYTVAGATVLKP